MSSCNNATDEGSMSTNGTMQGSGGGGRPVCTCTVFECLISCIVAWRHTRLHDENEWYQYDASWLKLIF